MEDGLQDLPDPYGPGGAGGAGKTRLADEAARRARRSFNGRVSLVELAAIAPETATESVRRAAVDVLAAARIKMLPPAEIERRLDDRFRLLRTGPRTADPRQQTLQALVDLSYALLSPADSLANPGHGS